MSDHIFLIGRMGAANSTVGKQLATPLGSRFFDLIPKFLNPPGPVLMWIFAMKGTGALWLRYLKLFVM